jgi:predicted transcriptional regulator
MSEVKNKILSFLESGYKIDVIIDELGIEKESLADAIIELDTKELISLNDKEWTLTQKGRDVLGEMKEHLKGLKVEYMYGNISKDEFWKKKKELEDIIVVEKPKYDNTKEKNMICHKCSKENKIGSKYCYKCGMPLSDT